MTMDRTAIAKELVKVAKSLVISSTKEVKAGGAWSHGDAMGNIVDRLNAVEIKVDKLKKIMFRRMGM
jgi:hypothetical protein